jgi:aminoglycoside/choline kinase family phosphotransferase
MKSSEEIIRFAREALGLSTATSIDVSRFEGRGSDRTIFRLKWNLHESAILVHYDPGRVENSYWADISVFLRDIHIPAPRLLHFDPVRCLILVEDLGDTDLWSLRDAPWETRRTLYQKTLAVVNRLHSFPGDEFPSVRVRLMESFGPDLYRWERNYFMDSFVRAVCGVKLEPSFEEGLERELLGLAERLDGNGRCLVHRDLQSQNVMIRHGEPVLIDFQGMRFGSPFYDLGSLLCDPYVHFSAGEQNDLLSFYYGLSKPDMDWPAFQTHFWAASAQRLMQALGAHGFLGLKKGLKAFLDHIPAGLRQLQRAAGNVSFLPRLLELSVECRKVIEKGNGMI